MRLQHKTAVITGGGGGIGRAAALRFAKEEASVVVSDWNAESGEETVRLVKQAGGEAMFVRADVASAPDVSALISKAVETFGSLDILCNNAGVGNEEVRLADMNLDEWEKVLSTNLKGVFLGMKYALPEMMKKGGSIINTSSVLGERGKKFMSPYNASKGGVITLTKTAALEYGKYNIRVNAIAPGVIDTSIVDNWRQDERKWSILSRANALGRIGKPEEAANAMLFLASDESSYITGTTLFIDGGATAL
jgi:NAD(P)-dependent dehydrogenase (short-subunit alcohol dehydrogenase family)